jgi:hypothetical protein
MSKTGYFEAKLNNINGILKNLDLLEERNHFPTQIQNPAEIFRKMSYIEVWKYCIKNFVFNFQLVDSSIILFNNSDFYPSFVFYGCPYDCLPYKDFVKENGFEYQNIGDALSNDYMLYLDNCTIHSSHRTIRYDYAPKQYREGLHPSSHIHIGYQTEIRIGLEKILDPLAFIMFVLRQLYPYKWDNFVNVYSNEVLLNRYKNNLDSIETTHYKKKDHWEFYLT